jgi:hypothetical protein
LLTEKGKQKPGRGGYNVNKYYLTADCFKAFCMMAGTKKGKEVRKYYLQIEKAWNDPEMVLQRALPELVKRGRHVAKHYADHMDSATLAADRVYKLQTKYKYENRVSKPDVDVLFQSAVVLKHYFDNAVIVTDQLVIHASALETKLDAMTKMLEENSRLVLEGKDVPAAQSDEWLDKLYGFFQVERRAAVRKQIAAAKADRTA